MAIIDVLIATVVLVVQAKGSWEREPGRRGKIV